MRIIIAGIGDVGFHLAKLTSSQNHDIVIIDTDKEKIAYAEDHLDIISYRGSSSSFKTLQDANVEDTDLFLAVTNSDEVNLTSCMIAKKWAQSTALRESVTRNTIQRCNNSFSLNWVSIL